MRRGFEFRVGIHLGDVVEESDGDLMGDGVSVAARARRMRVGSSFATATTTAGSLAVRWKGRHYKNCWKTSARA